MATNNAIKSRIQLKNDTEANWKKSVLVEDGGTKTSGTSFVPLQGELIIYSTDEAHPFSRLKIGDGVTNVVNLPFISSSYINGYQIFADTTANWSTDLTYIPNKGDMIVWLDKTVSNSLSIPGIKIGDGLAYNVDLPFVGDDILEIVNGHIEDIEHHITSNEREFWNNKINCEDIVIDETLILTRN